MAIVVVLAVFIFSFFKKPAGISPQPTAATETPAPVFVPSTSAVIYTENTLDVLENPFRGFYRHTETHSIEYSPLTVSQLKSYREQDHVTLILRIFYLEDFVNSSVSGEYLENIRNDLDVVREAGFSVIVRFAYTSNSTLPYGDAPKDIVLQHISQLAPIFQDYSDIVKVIQAGFIGAWGEWYYTDHFVQDPSSPYLISAESYQDRAEVVSALLQTIPETSFVQLRTPNYKLQLYPDRSLSSSNAYNGSDSSRIGFHNDCFLASPDDYGTYKNENEKNYLSSETVYTPMGGETCNPNPPRSSCPIALDELAFYHWSFLNLDYHPEVINNWKADGCFGEINQDLGYRFVLQRGIFSDQVQKGGSFNVELKLVNNGWAGLFTETKVEFVIRNIESQKEYGFIVADDPKTWLPSSDSYTISHSLCMPKDMETGIYKLFLRVSPSDTKNRSLYSIQLANDLVWEQNTGLTDLGHSFTVSQGTTDSICNNK